MTTAAWIAFSAGALWLWRLGAFGRRATGEAWYLALQAHAVVLAVISLALARARAFEATVAAGLAFALAAAVALVASAARRPDTCGPPGDVPFTRRQGALLAGGLAVCAAFWAAFPTYHVFGGRDPGIYLLAAVRIVRTGGVDFALPPTLLEGLPIEAVEDHESRWFFPGLYSARLAATPDAPLGEAVAQFMHLYSALAAHAFAVLGLEGLVRANVPLALLALWSLARLVRAWIGAWWALAAVATLALSPAWIYAARITMPEVHAAALALFGLELLRLAWRDRSAAFATASGLVGGVGVACRLDGVAWILVVFGFALAAAPQGAAARALARAVLVGFLVGAGAGLADGVAFSAPYVVGQWHAGVLKGPLAMVGLCLAASLTCVSPVGGAVRTGWPRWLALTGATALAAWLAWGLLGRPLVWPKDTNARAALELGWYTAPWVLALAAWGGLRFVAPAPSPEGVPPLDPPRAALAALAGGVLLAYTWRPGIFPDHPWASRRWVAFAIPLVAVLGMVGLRDLAGRVSRRALARPLAGLVVLATLAHHAWFVAPFACVALYAGIPGDLAMAAARLPRDGRPALAFDPKVATALTYYYDRPVLLLTAAGLDALAAGALDGFVLVGRTPFHHDLAGLDVAGAASGPALEHTERHWPWRIYEERFNLDTGTIHATQERLDASVAPDHASLVTRSGTRTTEGHLVSGGVAGVLLGGPYLRLGPGSYEAVWTGVLERNECATERFGECRIEGVMRLPRDRERIEMLELLRGAVPVGGPPRELARRRFQLHDVADKIELALSVRDGVWLRLTRVSLRRLD